MSIVHCPSCFQCGTFYSNIITKRWFFFILEFRCHCANMCRHINGTRIEHCQVYLLVCKLLLCMLNLRCSWMLKYYKLSKILQRYANFMLSHLQLQNPIVSLPFVWVQFLFPLKISLSSSLSFVILPCFCVDGDWDFNQQQSWITLNAILYRQPIGCFITSSSAENLKFQSIPGGACSATPTNNVTIFSNINTWHEMIHVQPSPPGLPHRCSWLTRWQGC